MKAHIVTTPITNRSSPKSSISPFLQPLFFFLLIFQPSLNICHFKNSNTIKMAIKAISIEYQILSGTVWINKMVPPRASMIPHNFLLLNLLRYFFKPTTYQKQKTTYIQCMQVELIMCILS